MHPNAHFPTADTAYIWSMIKQYINSEALWVQPSVGQAHGEAFEITGHFSGRSCAPCPRGEQIPEDTFRWEEALPAGDVRKASWVPGSSLACILKGSWGSAVWKQSRMALRIQSAFCGAASGHSLETC